MLPLEGRRRGRELRAGIVSGGYAREELCHVATDGSGEEECHAEPEGSIKVRGGVNGRSKVEWKRRETSQDAVAHF